MFSSSIDKEDINHLPLASFSGEIVEVDDVEMVEKAIAFLSCERIIGFDTETRPTFSKGRRNDVALLQLSGRNKAFLFRLSMIGLPQELLQIFEDEDIIKVGAAIKEDISSLQRLTKFTPKGFVDLQKIVENYGIEDKSVKKMAAIVLSIRVSKSQQLSNWECQEYSEAQKQYAATDAWVCREIYLELGRRMLQHNIGNEK